MLRIILLLLVLLRTFAAGQTDLFTYEKVTEDDSKPPLFVEEMQSINIYTKSWKIVAGIDMRSYDNELKHLDSAVLKITTFCKSISSNVTTSCTETAAELTNSIDEMKINWMQVTSMESEDNFNDIYLKKFDELKKTVPVNNKIVDDDATYIEVSRELISDNHDELENQREYLDRHLEKCKEILEENTKYNRLKEAELNDAIDEVFSYATIIVFNFQFEQNKFIEMLRSETILTEETLLHELRQLTDIIAGRKLKLPFDVNVEPMDKFYDVTTAKSKIIKNIFIVAYKLPLVESLSFTLYHLNTCPRKMKEELFQLMLPDYEYVAMSKDKEKYIILDDDEVKQCYHGNSLLCQLNSPIINTENSDSCSVNFLRKGVISTCNYIIANISSELWIRLEGNSWLFVFPKPTQVTVQCNGEVDSRYMNGEGILTIQPRCSAKTAFVHIIPSTDRLNKIYKRMTFPSETKNDWNNIVDKITAANNIVKHFIPRVMDQKDLDIFEKINIAVNHIKPLVQQTLKERTWYQLNEIEIGNCITIIVVILLMIFKTMNCIRRCCIRSTYDEAEDIDLV